MQKYGLYRQSMMWLMSTVRHFIMDVSQGASPNFSKGWCTRVLTTLSGSLFQNEAFLMCEEVPIVARVEPF